MNNEQIVTAVVLMLVVAFAARSLFPKPKPKDKHFKCGRCGTVALHSSRTIEAWRNNKTRFFCQTCHAQWLRENPRVAASRGKSTRSGCLGAVALLAVLPLAVFLVSRGYG